MSEEAARAWARIAEAESAAAYAHSAVGPRLSGAERERSLNELAEHRRQRDRAGVKQFAADEVRLIDTYDTVLSDASISDASRSRAQLFRDHHAAHLSALGGPPRSEPDESALPPLPQGQSASAGYLADLERSATRVRRDACTTATDPELVRVLALICSSEDLHARAWSGGPA